MSMIDHSSASRFSIGVPVIATLRRADSRRSARARFVAGFLTSCASSSSRRCPGDRGEVVPVTGCDVVGGDDDVGRARRVGQLGAGETEVAVVAVDAQRRREPLELRLPLLDDAHRADDEGGADVAVLALGGEHRDRLHRLAQAHVVGQDRAGAEIAEQPEPAVAALLEREQAELHRRRGRERREAALAALEQVGQRSIEQDRAELDACLVGLEPGDGPHEVDDAVARLAALQEAQRALDVGAVQGVPAAADLDERLLGGGELGELLVGEDVVADREPPVEPGELGRREETARPDRRPARRAQVDAQPAARPQPGGGQRDRDAPLLEPRDRLAQEEPHRRRARAPPRTARSDGSRCRPRRGAARSPSAAGSDRGARRPHAGTSTPRDRRSREAKRAGRGWDRPPPAARARARSRERPRAPPPVARRGGGRAATAPRTAD